MTSVKVYLPGARPSITCDSLVDTQASIKLPFSSLSSRWAPANSSPVVTSTLLISTTVTTLSLTVVLSFTLEFSGYKAPVFWTLERVEV